MPGSQMEPVPACLHQEQYRRYLWPPSPRPSVSLERFMPVTAPTFGLHFPPRSSLCPPLLCPLLKAQLFLLKCVRDVLAMLVVLPALVLQLVLSPQVLPSTL